jgi:hypothetical protein
MTNRNIDDLVAVAAVSAAIALSLNSCSGTSRTTSSTQSSETSQMGTMGTGTQAAIPDTAPGRDTVPVPSPPDTLPRPR